MARKIPEVNSASSADIAFLLLIFFIVSASMDTDSGLYRILPPMPPPDEQIDDIKIKERNIFVVLVNRNNELLVEGESLNLKYLKDKTIEFLTNPMNNENLPEKEIKEIPPFGQLEVSKGIISLQNDNGTDYNMYIKVLNELAAAGNIVRDQFCISRLNKKFDQIKDKDLSSAVRDAVPVIISEAEPKNIGGN